MVPGEFSERGRHAPVGARTNAEFIVTEPDVLHESVAAHDHAGGVIAFEAAHRAKPRLQAAAVGLDPIARILLRVVKRAGINSSITARSAGARSVTTSTGAP
jgi:hypothetical protein